ncbi:hypothetical protein MICAF_1790001 [Microcystis aeruginosa PCC 9807]|uniref:Uncharacterized protein n=1 Tax=Microcystis aeruginosa PCC 9807 TaxID=1160283 RepID=I4H280_MICAE|nr:hypothetical protein MICAF_1790001 [Microcystis aeruginosa PCC 9807]
MFDETQPNYLNVGFHYRLTPPTLFFDLLDSYWQNLKPLVGTIHELSLHFRSKIN